MTFAPLMVRANDEPDAMYGLCRESPWQISADKLNLSFHDTARGEISHDGTKLTARGRPPFPSAFSRKKGPIR